MPDLSTFLRQSSLTYSDCQTDCFKYIDSLPEGSKPRDLFKGSEGRLIIDYLCAFHSDIAYKILVGYCENLLIYANKIENIIANAESKGYNATRGSNIQLLCTFIPDQTSTISYLDKVGEIEDLGIYSLESKQIVAGEATSLTVVLGNLESTSYTVDDVNKLAYRFTASDISDDIKVSIDGKVTEISTDPIQALYGMLVAMTNSYGSVDLLDFSNLSSLATSSVTVYNGAYSLILNTYYTYKLGNNDVVYTSEPIGYDVVLYSDTELSTQYGVVTKIDIVSKSITVVGFSFGYVGTYKEYTPYYIYSLNNKDYYLPGPIEISMPVYEDSSFTVLFGTVTSLYKDSSTCVISRVTPVSDRGYVINAGSIITLEYIKLEDIAYSGASGSFYLGTLTNIIQLSSGTSLESAVEIQQNTILHEQTRNTIVARRDAKKLTKLSKKIIPGILNTNDYDYSPSTVAVTYVLDSNLPMTQTQLVELNSYLSESRAAGIPMPYIVNSFNVNMKLNTSITTSNIINKEQLQSQVNTIFENYNNNPGISVDFNTLEKKICSINSVTVCRFQPIASDYIPDQYFDLGSFIIKGIDSAFLAVAYNYQSGETEPDWNNTGLIEDGDLILKPIRWQYAQTWSTKNNLYIGQMVNPTVQNGHTYEVVAVKNRTGETEPAGAGYDKDIYWSQISYDKTAPYWAALNQTNYGDIVNISGNTDFSLVASGFRRKLDMHEPDWDKYSTSQVVNTSTVRFERIPLAGDYIAKGANLILPWNSYLKTQQTVI